MAAFVDLHVDGRSRLGHLPGLDGLRGLAVAGVVAFHAGFDRMVGGYLGVSTFFTLSGFLITSLLITGRWPVHNLLLKGFWGRRIRRLFPASVVTLILVVALFAPFVATADQLATMRGDVLASLLNLANWHFIVDGSSYGDLFVAPSPVLHFWSLAIEEQFYLLFPLLVWGAWKLFKGRVGAMGMLFGALSVAAVAWTILGGLSEDRIYFGTDTRSPELLIGAILALALSKRRLRQRLALRYPWRMFVVGIGAVALVVQLWLWWTLPQSTEWLYQGGFAVYALLTGLVIMSAAVPGGPVYLLCTTAVLRWLGARSYAIYLIHWPLFLAFRQLYPNLNRWLMVAAAVSITLLLAEASFRFLERPIRLGVWPRPRLAPAAMFGSAVILVALLFLTVPSKSEGQTPDFDQALADYQDLLVSSPTVPPADADSEIPAAPGTPPIPSFAMYGDSTALGVGWGLTSWGNQTGRLGTTEGDIVFGCSVARFERQSTEGEFVPRDECRNWPQRWAQQLTESDPDIVVLLSPAWSVADSLIPGAEHFTSVGDPATDQFIIDELTVAVDLLSSKGALVLLTTYPTFGSWASDGKSSAFGRQADPARMIRFTDLLKEVSNSRPDTTAILDLAAVVGDRAQDQDLRPDGIHFPLDSFTQIAAGGAGKEIEDLWGTYWSAQSGASAVMGASSGG